jgi:Na+/H+ antiporter NhaD/arsenite permease-like protein
MILAIYYLWDRLFCYPKESKTDVAIDKATVRPLSIRGLMPNLLLLLGVVFSIAFLSPTKPIFGWHPWPFLREIVQLGLVFLSLALGSVKLREENHFNYHAILEVAALFIGVFICMQPAIEILHQRGGELGLTTAKQLYWATGGLSAVLDNAPTYVVFYETAAAEFVSEDYAQLVSAEGPKAVSARLLLIGISLGAVFMGAMTYIGNGPNFMVRAIAEESGVKMPSFFGYVVRYSIPVLLPVFFVVSYLFL